MKKKALLYIMGAILPLISSFIITAQTLHSFFLKEYHTYIDKTCSPEERHAAFCNIEFILPVIISPLSALDIDRKLEHLILLNNDIHKLASDALAYNKNERWTLTVSTALNHDEINYCVKKIRNDTISMLKKIQQGTLSRDIALQQETHRFVSMRTMCNLLLNKTYIQEEALVNYIMHDPILVSRIRNWEHNDSNDTHTSSLKPLNLYQFFTLQPQEGQEFIEISLQ